MHQLYIKNPAWFNGTKFTLCTSGDLRSVAERRGYTVTSFPLHLTYDITAAFFNDETEFGNKLLDFFSMTAYFRRSASREMLEEMMSAWRSQAVKGTDGRWSIRGDQETLIISKSQW